MVRDADHSYSQSKNQAQDNHKQVTLGSRDLLACLVTDNSTVVLELNTLAIEDRCGGAAVFTHWLPDQSAQAHVDSFPIIVDR